MNGCNWQEKSFSVAMMEKPIVSCRDCGTPANGEYKYNGDTLCKPCFNKKGVGLKFSQSRFFTEKDKRWEFTTDMFNGKPINIQSKRQFNRLLKQNGLVFASVKELRQEADFRKRLTSEDTVSNRHKLAENIYGKLKQKRVFK
jgi:hypothetical protein